MGCNTKVQGNKARNLSVYLSLSQTSKNVMSLIISYLFSSTKSENKRAEQVLPERGGAGGGGRRGR
jgi:hypothetical protein